MSNDKPTTDPVTGPVKTPPTEPKPETEAVQSGAVAGRELDHDAPVQVAHRTGMFGSSLGNDTSGYGGLNRPVLFPGAATRPYGSYFDQIVDDLISALGSAAADAAIERVVVDRGELTIFVQREHLPVVAQALRDEASLRFETCLGVSGVNYPQETGRELHAVYHFHSITNGSKRVRLEVTAPDGDAHIPSIVPVYPGADWHERETWDMFGIVFDGHPALTRILMPDDWPGHPQRKDYPLGGIPVEYKGATVPPADDRRSYK
ncbi:NADH-quinone oxidoreductase subunit C [Rudaeicoccus suwonensis]|uniref:NADH-quinone oxidoreductase subunit C n=1 Tax=Rudaeicoccus suwonensis TaxID=657409 RepID=A0A561E7E5_9MICO|nr:NADH-quinone oxidoreductase subunit C [Rudaeicoccus suwonensis]TWE11545.1 NADH dehydrogenase subunit C [Rudaeicoccus suwonensis]